MFGYLIDPADCTVRVVTVPEDPGKPGVHLSAIVRHIGGQCRLVDAVQIDSRDHTTAWVDDEGLYHDEDGARGRTLIRDVGAPREDRDARVVGPLAGRILVLGHDPETGEAQSPKTSIAALLENLRWLLQQEIDGQRLAFVGQYEWSGDNAEAGRA